jgi:hypothetical protein
MDSGSIAPEATTLGGGLFRSTRARASASNTGASSRESKGRGFSVLIVVGTRDRGWKPNSSGEQPTVTFRPSSKRCGLGGDVGRRSGRSVKVAPPRASSSRSYPPSGSYHTAPVASRRGAIYYDTQLRLRESGSLASLREEQSLRTPMHPKRHHGV